MRQLVVVLAVLALAACYTIHTPEARYPYYQGATGPCGGREFDRQLRPKGAFYEEEPEDIRFYIQSIVNDNTFNLSILHYDVVTEDELDDVSDRMYAHSFERWIGLDDGGSISDLTDFEDYPDFPYDYYRSRYDYFEYIVGSLEAPDPAWFNSGTRAYGLFLAPYSGDYKFWISGDDTAELYLSTNDKASSKTKIASVPKNGRVPFTSPRSNDEFSSQESDYITLVEGGHYYIEVRQASEDGANYWTVSVEVPPADPTVEGAIPTYYDTLPNYFIARSDAGPSDRYHVTDEIILYRDEDAGIPATEEPVMDPPVTGGGQYPYLSLDLPEGSRCRHCAIMWNYGETQHACADVVIFSHDRDDYTVTFTFQVEENGTPMLPASFRTRFLNLFTEDMGFIEGETVFFLDQPDEYRLSGSTYSAKVNLGNNLEYSSPDLAETVEDTPKDDMSVIFVDEVVDVSIDANAAFVSGPSSLVILLSLVAALYQLL